MNELLTSGVELMLLGMVTVYAFLGMLVVAIGAMSSLVRQFFPDMPQSHVRPVEPMDDPGIIAAIGAALQQYRRKYPRD